MKRQIAFTVIKTAPVTRSLRIAFAVTLIAFLPSYVVPTRLQAGASDLDTKLDSNSKFTSNDATQSRAGEIYARLPLSFEANQGQTDSSVKFLSHGGGFALFLTDVEAVIQLGNSDYGLPEDSFLASSEYTNPKARIRKEKSAVLRMKLVGANPAPHVEGFDQLPGRSNYFIGRDSARWQTDVPSYAKVSYLSVYPGVDLTYYGNQRQLEYDLNVAAGVDVKRIALAFDGARKVRVDRAGDLVVSTNSDDVRWHKPVAYQEVSGSRKYVASKYALRNGRQVGFEVGAYDRTKPLTIDPVLSYSTYLGGTGEDEARGIAVDSGGNIYVTGATVSTNFPLKNAADTVNPNYDAFVTKLTPDGSHFVYSTYFRGSVGSGNNYPVERGNAIAADASGSAYVTGFTASTDFYTTPGAFQSKIADGEDAFVIKLSPAGSVAYSTYLGGVSTNIYGDEGNGIAVDAAGNAYITGSTASQDNPFTTMVNEGFPTVNPFQVHVRSGGDPRDAFFTKLNPRGDALVYSSYLGGNGDDVGYGIAIDSNGSAYITGSTVSTDFPVLNAFQTKYGGTGPAGDAFVTKVDPSGRQLVYSSYLGGSSVDIGYGIAVDSAGSAYVTGVTASSDFHVKDAFQPALSGSNDAFVTKVDTAGALVYSSYLGGSSMKDEAHGIAVDGAGNAYVTGFTASINAPKTDFPTTPDALQITTDGLSFDAFVTKVNAAGSKLDYSTYLGGSGEEQGYGIAVDSAGNIYVAGITRSTNFPTINPLQASNAGKSDAFVAKFAPGTPAPISLTPACVATAVNRSNTLTIAINPARASVTAVNVTSSNPSVASVPATVTIPAGTTLASFIVTSAAVAGPATITATLPQALGGGSAATNVAVSSPPTMSLAPATQTIGLGVQGRLTVTIGAALNCSTVLDLTASKPGVVSVPPTVTIPAGNKTASFIATGVAFGGPVSITATMPAILGGGEASASVTVARPTISLAPLSQTIAARASGMLTVTISQTANSDTIVTLTSSQPRIVSVQTRVTIPSGMKTASFPVKGLSVGTSLIVATIPAGLTARATVTVN
jgi:hypothetical protein